MGGAVDLKACDAGEYAGGAVDLVDYVGRGAVDLVKVESWRRFMMVVKHKIDDLG